MNIVKGVFVKRIFTDSKEGKEGFDLILSRNPNPIFLVSYFKKTLIPLCEMGMREYYCSEYCQFYNFLTDFCQIPHVWVEFYHPHEDDYVCRPCRPANEKELELAGIKPR